MYICLCNGITDRDIQNCVASGANSLGDLQSALGIGTQCGRCQASACEILDEHSRRATTFLPQAA